MNRGDADTPLFAADSMVRSFGDRRVLKSASVWARPGRITTLLGRNGCGKSTLLRCAVGELRAEQGATHFAGRVHVRPRLERLARDGLTYLPDRGALARNLPIGRQLDAFAWTFGTDGERAAVIERMRLGPLLGSYVDDLSGGEVRRAAVAVALLRRPRCLLADEPFDGISPVDAEALGDALRALATAGTAVVVTGHQVRLLLDLADDVVWMAAGTTHHIGSATDARNHEQFRREYLGPAA